MIAEIGVNHNGKLDQALELIRCAKATGADAAKFQLFEADNLASPTASLAPYQAKTTNPASDQRQLLRRLQLPKEWLNELQSECKRNEIDFLVSVFSREDAIAAIELNQTCIKVPSGEIENRLLLELLAQWSGKVILSTGASSMSEVLNAVATVESAGGDLTRWSLLQCTTSYPTPLSDVNLSAIKSIRDATGVTVGFSDHTPSLLSGALAVMVGAEIVEKHITLDREMEGPDHKASLSVSEFRLYVNAIRDAEAMLGDGQKKVELSELENQLIIRKSIVARRAIKAGHTISIEDLAFLRPAGGISPREIEKLLGAKAVRDFSEGERLEV